MRIRKRMLLPSKMMLPLVDMKKKRFTKEITMSRRKQTNIINRILSFLLEGMNSK